MDEYLQMITDIQEDGDGVTEWELEFLDSIADQLAGDRPLTSKQKGKIEDIYRERVS